jgi:tetrameric-type glycyl-tRNA synthetase beta subunit
LATLLLEIGTEELPASACREATAQLPELCQTKFGRRPDEVFVGPRRIAFLLRDFDPTPPGRWLSGPPAAIAFDADGNPTKALIGFARKNGFSEDQVREAIDRRGSETGIFIEEGAAKLVRNEDGSFGMELRGESVEERLAEVVRGLSFGKSMVWRVGGLRFSRPVRWLVALLDAQPLALDVDGIPSGTGSQAHRFLGAAPTVTIASAEAYAETLRGVSVEPDAEERRRLIREGLDGLGDWTDPLDKLEEVIHLVEHPTVLEGRYDERHLALPEQVRATAMQSHQRYFPLPGARFGFVANAGDAELVRAGNEWVLEDRLDDASFTFERDVAKGIDTLAEELASITFLAGAGSYAEKSERLVDLVRRLGGGEASLEAARLAKADQAAELVREFAELEGYIGAEYARLAGYPEAVCAAIEEQYLPDSAGGPLPATEPGRVLAAADKLDNLRVAFELGKRPSGSRDPFGLRRAAIGLCRLALEGGLAIDLDLLPRDAAEFVEERLEGLLDVPVEVLRAVRASSVRELGALARLAQALAALDEERLAKLHTAYTRAERIAAKHDAPAELRSDLLTEPAEREVAALLTEVEPELTAALAAGDFDAAFSEGARLAEPLERFFTDVLVMAEDSAVRGNRLRLLLDVRDALGRLADFAQLQR